MIPSEKQMYDALVERQGKTLVDKLQSTTVAICGLGGLGSNVAISLARAGVGKLILIDFDEVDVTNLHRQQYMASQVGLYKTEALESNLSEIAPYMEVESYNEKIDESNAYDLLKDADIICEAFDNPQCKAMLTNFVLEKMRDKYLVAASGMAGLGSSNSIKTRRVSDKFYLCGDERSDVNDGIGLVSSRVMLCASHEANAIIRIIDNQFDA